MQTWPEYLRRVTGGLPPAEISKRSGIQLSTITRWLAGETKPSNAKLDILAKHFPMKLEDAHDVLAAYTARPRVQTSGQVFQIGSHGFSRKRLLRMYSDLELATEIVRRIEDHDSVEFPLAFDPEVHAGEDMPDNVHTFPARNVPPTSEDLEEVAGHSDIPHEEDTDDYIP